MISIVKGSRKIITNLSSQTAKFPILCCARAVLIALRRLSMIFAARSDVLYTKSYCFARQSDGSDATRKIQRIHPEWIVHMLAFNSQGYTAYVVKHTLSLNPELIVFLSHVLYYSTSASG
jgi:hypothetical protein